jgi:hypothetical protein
MNRIVVDMGASGEGRKVMPLSNKEPLDYYIRHSKYQIYYKTVQVYSSFIIVPQLLRVPSQNAVKPKKISEMKTRSAMGEYIRDLSK